MESMKEVNKELVRLGSIKYFAPEVTPLKIRCIPGRFMPPPRKDSTLWGGVGRNSVVSTVNHFCSAIKQRLTPASNSSSKGTLRQKKRTVFTHKLPVKIVTSTSTNSLVSSSTSKISIPSSKSLSEVQIPHSKFITVIRMGPKPRKVFRILLSRKIARSFEQFLTAVTEKIQPNWGAVRKMYGLDGKEITSLKQLLESEESIFFACPNERLSEEARKLTVAELLEIQKYMKNPLKPKSMLTTSSSDIKICKRNDTLKKENSLAEKNRRNSTKGKNSFSKTKKSCKEKRSLADKKLTEPEDTGPKHPKYIRVEDYPEDILNKYHVGDIIGDGNFAVVRECTRRINDEKYALKVIGKAQSEKSGCDIAREVNILRKIRHPNIIMFFERFDFPDCNECYMIMELIKGGDLYYAIKDATRFSEEQSQMMIRDVASALAFIHSRAIVHRDVKPENLLIFTDGWDRLRLKLTDFGMATFVDRGPLYEICGTPTYISPEMISKGGYSTKVDMWALGIITYVLLCGYHPFHTETDSLEELYVLITTSTLQFLTDEWENISVNAKDIIHRMVEKNAEVRYCARDVLEHPWLGQLLRTDGCRREFNFKKVQQIGLNNAPSLFDDRIIPPSNY